ncbi:MAG: endonuclease/exonuclease/phosphatase family protein, partial [Chitinophagaceae bacterium]
MATPSSTSPRLFLLFAGILVSTLYLLVCIAPYINAGDFWFVAILGLGFPFILIALFVLFVIELLFRSRRALVLLAVMLIGFQQINWAFGFNFFSKDFERVKEDNSIRVMTWNVFRWNEQRKPHGEESSRNLMMDAVEQQYADVLCFQEFFQPYSSNYPDNLQKLREMGYPYSYFYPTSSIMKGHFKFGMAIVSRYPIIDSAKFSFGETPHSEGLMYADIKVNEKVIRVFSVHMESFRMGKRGYFDGVSGRGGGAAARNTLSRIRSAYEHRSSQAE